MVKSATIAAMALIGVVALSSQPPTAPAFAALPDWPALPSQWRLGDVSSVAVDAQQHIWLLHRPRTLPREQWAAAAPPVLEFDTAGKFIQGWGGPGAGYEWPQREHGLHIDHKGFVWIGGNNDPTRKLPGLDPVYDDQILKFTRQGRFVMQFGRSNSSRGNDDTANFHMPADTYVYPPTNELFVADGYGNNRVIVVDADTGRFKRMWGAFGRAPKAGPDAFDTVHTVRVSNDGLVYVADRGHKRVQVFTLQGRYLREMVLNRPSEGLVARSLAFSADRAQQYLYIGGTPEIIVVDRQTLGIVSTIEPANPHHIATAANGDIYSAELAVGRGIQKFLFKGLVPIAK